MPRDRQIAKIRWSEIGSPTVSGTYPNRKYGGDIFVDAKIIEVVRLQGGNPIMNIIANVTGDDCIWTIRSITPESGPVILN